MKKLLSPLVLVIAACLVLAGCAEENRNRLGIRLTVGFAKTLELNQLLITTSPEEIDGAEPRSRLVPPQPTKLASGVTVLLLLPEGWADHPVQVEVQGLQDSTPRARGADEITMGAGEIVDLFILLSEMCQDSCTAGEAQCLGDQIRRCEKTARGCAQWTLPEDCPADSPFCSLGKCEATCTEECATDGERRCSGDSYQQCGQHDSDDCLEWGGVLPCGQDEICRSTDGQCVQDCGGQPCPCTDGETKACQDVGQCSDGTRHCEDGQFGACDWTVGPQVEICDGLDNDCDTEVDEELIPEGCAKQQGVCSGAAKTCGGTAGWLDCSDAEYQAHAQLSGVNYEASENSCDGKDNDCNGQVDEPAQCCQPSCTGKACGADDGCGHDCDSGSCPGSQEICMEGICVCQPDCAAKACGADDGCGGACQTGSCGANGTCVSGSCVCDFISCGTACCAQADTCFNGSCCTPSCGSRVCGVEPTCQTSCGSCSTGEICDINGQCKLQPVDTDWDEVPVPTGTKELNAVWGNAPTNYWAAGKQDLLHYNGTAWTNQLSVTNIRDIWGASSSDVWAVGDEIRYYDGTSWQLQPNPSFEKLRGVWGSSATDVWAVGENGAIMRYDGSNWNSFYSPTTKHLNEIHGLDASHIWAVSGSDLVLFFNGVEWTSTTVQGVHNSVWALGASDVWVGSHSGRFRHWDGSYWNLVDTGFDCGITALWGSATNNVYALCAFNLSKLQVLHYDGSGWTKQTMQYPDDYVFDIFGTSANDIWITAYQKSSPYNSYMLHHP